MWTILDKFVCCVTWCREGICLALQSETLCKAKRLPETFSPRVVLTKTKQRRGSDHLRAQLWGSFTTHVVVTGSKRKHGSGHPRAQLWGPARLAAKLGTHCFRVGPDTGPNLLRLHQGLLHQEWAQTGPDTPLLPLATPIKCQTDFWGAVFLYAPPHPLIGLRVT